MAKQQQPKASWLQRRREAKRVKRGEARASGLRRSASMRARQQSTPRTNGSPAAAAAEFRRSSAASAACGTRSPRTTGSCGESRPALARAVSEPPDEHAGPRRLPHSPMGEWPASAGASFRNCGTARPDLSVVLKFQNGPNGSRRPEMNSEKACVASFSTAACTRSMTQGSRCSTRNTMRLGASISAWSSPGTASSVGSTLPCLQASGTRGSSSPMALGNAGSAIRLAGFTK